jgi:hypothetical protein
MFIGPLRLISLVFAVIVVGLPAAAIAFFLLAIMGSPGSCEQEGRTISYEPLRAVAFQQTWDQLEDTLDAGQESAAVFDEQQVTARARLWVEERDAPVSDLLICFTSDGGAASGKVDIPLIPGDIDVLIRATVDLRGDRPEVEIEEMEIGRVPGPLADLAESAINELIEQQMEELPLRHDYGAMFGDGEVTLNGQP